MEPLRFTVLWGGVPHCALTSSIRREGIWMTLPLAWFLMWKLPNNLTARLFGGEILSPPPEAGDRLQLERWLEDFTSGGAERRRVLLLEIEARFHRLALASPRRSRSIRGGKPLATGLDHVERITDYIAAHYQEPMSVGQIARALGFHEKYLMRLFRRHSRMCIWEYVTRMRLAHAQRLLLTSDMKILDIALDSGFASLGPFYRAFAGLFARPAAPARLSAADGRGEITHSGLSVMHRFATIKPASNSGGDISLKKRSIIWPKQVVAVVLTVVMVVAVAFVAQQLLWQYALREASKDKLEEMDRNSFLIESRLRGRANDMFFLKRVAEAEIARNPQAPGGGRRPAQCRRHDDAGPQSVR